MKDQKTAGVLALLFGFAGIHRFYLGQYGLGVLYILFIWMLPLMVIIGIIDAIALLSMDQSAFDMKYNRSYLNRQRRRVAKDRYYEKRETQKGYQNKRKTTPKARIITNSPFKKSGIEKFKAYDYDGAVEDFTKALEDNPSDVAVHFNMACAYSLTEEVDKALTHIDLAVQNGFNDFEKIKTHDALAFLRIQPSYEAFVENGFKIPSSQKAAKQQIEKTGDLLEDLKQLEALRQKGLLSEEQFMLEKKKLLQ